MTIAIMQPYFLPYIGYLQLMDAVDTFVLYDDVAFINRGWINRNRLLINGQEHLFTIPLRDASQNKRINEVHLADDPKWRGKLLKTIEQGYRKTPNYATVMPLTEKIVNFATDSIAEMCGNSLVELTNFLGITTRLVPSSAIYENSELKAQERIIDICRQEGATRYINPIGGQELYNKVAFAERGLTLHFMQSRATPYSQLKQPDFMPWLSVLDVLMNNDVPATRAMLGDFELL